MEGGVVVTECLVVEDDGYFLDFSGFKEYLFISLEFLFRASKCWGTFADINLCRSSPVPLSGIADTEANGQLTVFGRSDAEVGEPEGRVAESEAEWV